MAFSAMTLTLSVSSVFSASTDVLPLTFGESTHSFQETVVKGLGDSGTESFSTLPMTETPPSQSQSYHIGRVFVGLVQVGDAPYFAVFRGTAQQMDAPEGGDKNRLHLFNYNAPDESTVSEGLRASLEKVYPGLSGGEFAPVIFQSAGEGWVTNYYELVSNFNESISDEIASMRARAAAKWETTMNNKAHAIKVDTDPRYRDGRWGNFGLVLSYAAPVTDVFKEGVFVAPHNMRDASTEEVNPFETNYWHHANLAEVITKNIEASLNTAYTNGQYLAADGFTKSLFETVAERSKTRSK